MIIVKAPFRISFFGGSTDYKEFYEQHGSFLIGTTIDKNVYLSMRKRPPILPQESIITYSQQQIVKNWDEIHNPLIREILKYRNIDQTIEFNSFSDVPSRTGLGGSSSFCVGMLYLLNKVFGKVEISPKELAYEAIHIERVILREAGGIQDQIWPAYGGLNTIEIQPNGNFLVKPLAVTKEFREELQKSMLLIYTNDQREQNSIAKSHEHKDKTAILQIAKEAHRYFLNEDIEGIGKLLRATWEEKQRISPFITTGKINKIIDEIRSMGACGWKLLGAGGCGFILVLCNPITKQKLYDIFANNILEFSFEESGVSVIYNGGNDDSRIQYFTNKNMLKTLSKNSPGA